MSTDRHLIDDTPGARIWRGEGWELREGRWEDSPPEVVDVTIGDPPFTDHVSANQRRSKGNGARAGWQSDGQHLDIFGLSFDGIDPADLAPHLLALARRWVLSFCAAEQLGAYEEAAGGRWPAGSYVRNGRAYDPSDEGGFVCEGRWEKTNPTPQFTGDRPAESGESFAIMHAKPGPLRWNGGGRPARYVGPFETEPKVHETQKPLWLMRALVLDFSDPGELVWDPYAGSATTGVACLAEGRRFLGHEMQAHYAEVAAERLAAAEDGFTLREARALHEHGEYQRAKRMKQASLALELPE